MQPNQPPDYHFFLDKISKENEIEMENHSMHSPLECLLYIFLYLGP